MCFKCEIFDPENKGLNAPFILSNLHLIQISKNVKGHVYLNNLALFVAISPELNRSSDDKTLKKVLNISVHVLLTLQVTEVGAAHFNGFFVFDRFVPSMLIIGF